LLLERQAEQAEVGVLFPQRAAEAARLFHIGLALLEIVAVLEQALDAALEQPLFFAELEVHLLRPIHRVRHCEEPEGRRSNPGSERVALDCFASLAMTNPHNPNIAFAMMFFWISLVPP